MNPFTELSDQQQEGCIGGVAVGAMMSFSGGLALVCPSVVEDYTIMPSKLPGGRVSIEIGNGGDTEVYEGKRADLIRAVRQGLDAATLYDWASQP